MKPPFKDIHKKTTRCDCGEPLVGFYARQQEECTRCEDLREGESVLCADMLDHR